jgi:hypothetical protein
MWYACAMGEIIRLHPHIPESEVQPQYTPENTKRVMKKMWDLFDEVKKRRAWLEDVRKNETSETKESTMVKQIGSMTEWLHKVSERIHDGSLTKLNEEEFWTYMKRGEELLGMEKDKKVIPLTRKERAA